MMPKKLAISTATGCNTSHIKLIISIINISTYKQCNRGRTQTWVTPVTVNSPHSNYSNAVQKSPAKTTCLDKLFLRLTLDKFNKAKNNLYGAASCRNRYCVCWLEFSWSDCTTTRDFVCPGRMSWPSASSTFIASQHHTTRISASTGKTEHLTHCSVNDEFQYQLYQC